MVHEKIKWCLTRKIRSIAFLFLLAFGLSFRSSAWSQPIPDSKTRLWLKESVDFHLGKIIENISPSDGLPGAVIAARTRHNPNYYYHWVRDAGIAIDSLINVYQVTTSDWKKDLVSRRIFEYLDFSTKIQKVKTLSDLGEPKFNVDGSAFNEQWGRPQNDGPALRAISLIHWANVLLSEGKENIVREKMYQASIPAVSPIKMDLEYISHHWREPSYDIWEEVKGMHFYTLMVQRRALLEGAVLARRLGDTGAADWYQKQGKEIEVELAKFWNPEQGFIVSTLDRSGGVDYKSSNVDSSVILGLLHGGMEDGFFAWDDKRVLGTLEKIVSSFAELYPINKRPEIPGVAIGRYPEDRYAGSNFNGGNPWPLCTLAVAEALYRSAEFLANQGKMIQAQEMANAGDKFVERVRYHGHKNGSLSEQMDKNTGYMTSVSDLTWNYAALLSTMHSTLALN